MGFSAVLLDLDGVIRHFDPAHRAEVEVRHGLAAGQLFTTAFERDLANDLVTGRLTRAQWAQAVAERTGNRRAVIEWLSDRGVTDENMLAECDRLRSMGYTVAVLTNGTDEIADEVDQLGISAHVDAVFNSWDIRYAKPHPAAFRHCCLALDVDPASVFFTDDTEAKLAGATEIGMTARHFIGFADFRRHLDELGIR